MPSARAEREQAEASTRFMANPIGYGRDVPGRYAERVSADDLYWDVAAHGGQVSVLGLRSPGAQALRVFAVHRHFAQGRRAALLQPGEPRWRGRPDRCR